MMSLQFYKNNGGTHEYGTLTPKGTEITATPVNMDFKSGTLRIQHNNNFFDDCNYVRIKRQTQILYAWIENIKFIQDTIFNVTYRVDPFRTFRSRVNWGHQFIERSPEVTFKRDDLLASSEAFDELESITFRGSNTNSRVFVVQVRPNADELNSKSPIQPTPYAFYLTSYDVRDWKTNSTINQFFAKLSVMGETDNIVTAYSIPYIDMQDMVDSDLVLRSGSSTETVKGFKRIPGDLGNKMEMHKKLTRTITVPLDNINVENLMTVEHKVSVVVPEAGIIDIPDELLGTHDVKIRHDVDLFSGASNYMLVNSSGDKFTQSVRGNSVSSIPILSDPEATYLSQNQSALTTSLIGDVASIGIGAGMTMLTGGAGAMAGGGSIASGLNGILNRNANIKDAGNQYSNPPAFLGTALSAGLNNTFWIVIKKQRVDNRADVNNNFGYPLNRIGKLTLPSNGYIKTQGCSLSNDGTVPKWAIEEIEQLLDSGMYFH